MSSYRPLGCPPLVRGGARDNGEGRLAMPASTHFAHGTPPNVETNTCYPREGYSHRTTNADAFALVRDLPLVMRNAWRSFKRRTSARTTRATAAASFTRVHQRRVHPHSRLPPVSSRARAHTHTSARAMPCHATPRDARRYCARIVVATLGSP